MENFLNWLDAQSGARLFGYCLFILFALYAIFEGTVEIIKAIRKNRNS